MARKRFGQHFLTDPDVVRRIIAALSPRFDDCVIEIGPGRGALTGPLLARLDRLHVVELDRDLAGLLRERYGASSHLVVHQADALEFDFTAVRGAKPLRLIGNLPYNVSTPLLFRLLGLTGHVEDMIFMLQKEVVDRICAGPGSRRYGRLSVAVQHRCAVEPLWDVPPEAFTPPPKVVSGVLRLRPYVVSPWPVADPAGFDTLVQTAFSYRRKTLRRALAGLAGPDDFDAAGIDPGDRPEQLSVSDYVRLTDALARRRDPRRMH